MILDKIKSEIVVPLIEFIFLLALLYFLWGVVKFIRNADNPAGRQEGQRHMVWGVIGLAIMLSAFGIVNFVFNSVTKPDSDTTVYGIDGNPIDPDKARPDILKNGKF